MYQFDSPRNVSSDALCLNVGIRNYLLDVAYNCSVVCVLAGTVRSNDVAPESTTATALGLGHTAKVVHSCTDQATDCEGLEEVATHSWLMEKQTLLERIKIMELERDSLLVNMMKLQDELYNSENNRQPIPSRPF